MSAIAKLPKTWQEWIEVNLERKVPLEKIADILTKQGWAEAGQQLLNKEKIISSKPSKKLPIFDFDANTICLTDRKVNVLFVSSEPTLAVFDNFLSDTECDRLIESAQPKLKVSRVVNSSDGRLVEHNARTSLSTSFQRGANKITKTIEGRISELMNWPVDNAEGLQILKYEDGGEYRPHFDFFDPAQEGSAKMTQKGGQRVGTLLIYLSDVEQGGATRFPKLNFEVRPKKGMALYFSNVHNDGSINPMTLHAGIPVTKGVKYLATKWLREKPYI